MDTVSIVAHVTCVWLVRIQLWVPFYFILTENKKMGSGHFYKKRTDFAWVDRQPAFTTGGAPGLHMYSTIYTVRHSPRTVFSPTSSRYSFTVQYIQYIQYSIYTVYSIYSIYCIYTVRLRAR